MLLSIIVTTYNLNRFAKSGEDKQIIYKTLDSIAGQSLDKKDYEVIIVDDCSTDGTFDIINEYATNIVNMHAISLFTNSGGPSKPRNVGISLSSAKYITFLDGDDFYGGKKALEKIKNHILNNHFDLAYLKRFSPDSRKVPRGTAHGNNLVMEDSDIIKNWMYAENAPGIKVVKRKLLVENNIYFKESIHWGEDKVFGMEILTIPGLKTNILNDYDYYYWRTSIEGQGLTAKKWTKQMYHQNAYEINELLNAKILLNPSNLYLKELWYQFFSYEFRTLPLLDEELIKNIIDNVSFTVDFSQFSKDVRNKVILAGKYNFSFEKIDEIRKLPNNFKSGMQKIIYKKSETESYEIEYFPSLYLDLDNAFKIVGYEFENNYLTIKVKPDFKIGKSEYDNINMIAQTSIDSQIVNAHFRKYFDGFTVIFEMDLSQLSLTDNLKNWWKLLFVFDETSTRVRLENFANSLSLDKSMKYQSGIWKLNLHPKGFVDLHKYREQ